MPLIHPNSGSADDGYPHLQETRIDPVQGRPKIAEILLAAVIDVQWVILAMIADRWGNPASSTPRSWASARGTHGTSTHQVNLGRPWLGAEWEQAPRPGPLQETRQLRGQAIAGQPRRFAEPGRVPAGVRIRTIIRAWPNRHLNLGPEP